MAKLKTYASFEGFKYLIKSKPYRGAFVDMANFARALLNYGGFDEYHAYFDDMFFHSLTPEESRIAFSSYDRLKLKSLQCLRTPPDSVYQVIHFEELEPFKEVLFRHLLGRQNTPLTRRVYTISTHAQQLNYLELCMLNNGGRPYDSIIVPSTATRETLLRYFSDVESVTAGRVKYGGRIDVIAHGIHTDEFENRDPVCSRQKLGLPIDDVILLSLAHISYVLKMNYDRLLISFMHLTKMTDQNLCLVIAGSDTTNESRRILNMAKELGIVDRIRLITNFDDEVKGDLFSCADIFISLSDNLQESFGIALVEAMAMGLPVVCTDWDGYKDVVEEGVCGFRIPIAWKPRDYAEKLTVGFAKDPNDHTLFYQISKDLKMDTKILLSRVVELIHNEALRKEMGKNARNRALRLYSIKTVIAQFVELWNELYSIAALDTNSYEDMAPVLCYNYSRHFKSYPSSFF
jgi:D-inositol-3-phosphate glycosyltransferase